MSLNLTYYLENDSVTTTNDLNRQTPMTQKDCNHFYFGHSPMGHYLDLGAKPIAGRPVWKPFRVGGCTPLSPTDYVQAGHFNCKQPCWKPNCK